MVHFYYRISIFLMGIILGALLGKVCIVQEKNNVSNPSSNPSYNTWFKNNQLIRKNLVTWDNLRYNKNLNIVLEAEFLSNKVTVLCLVLLRNHKNEQPIRDTWAKRCNTVRFINLVKDKMIPVRRDPKKSSWIQLCKALQIVENFNWVLIVSDYTFVIMESLRYFLAPLIPTNQYYFGHTIKFWGTLYNSRNGGIVISKGTIEEFKKSLYNSTCESFSYWNREDYYLGKTLANLNIIPTDTRDSKGYSRFQPSHLHSLIFNDYINEGNDVYPFKCCSKNAISFRAVDGDKMYTYYYLIYTVQLFANGNLGNIPNSQKDDDQVWKNFLNDRNVSNDISNEEYYKVWEDLIQDPILFAAKMKADMDYAVEI